ncbi:phospho-2-dehydro-3-deoxyheptonate aldolase [Bradyrhizobium sp. LM2.7]
MLSTTDDLRIRELKELSTPEEVMREVPRTLTATRVVMASRNAIHAILNGQDDRLLVVVGPCSVHDPKAALDYAERLASLREDLADQLEIVMRVYFEKPRTTVGWKGLINDPDLDGSFDINKGLRLARNVLSAINNLGLPAGAEFLDMTTPQYIADLVSWAAIGARTTESQIHRELALRPVLSGRIQKRHRRQRPHRGGRRQVGLASASFHGGDQARPLGDRLDRRQ